MNYEIWTDGSTNGCGSEMGAGWVIRDQFGNAAEYISPVLSPRHGSSNIAEIMAATMALRSIPDGSCISLYTDSEDLISCFEHRDAPLEFHSGLSKLKVKRYEALHDFFKAVSRHESVNLHKTEERSDANLKAAHCHARDASEIGKQTIPYSGYKSMTHWHSPHNQQ